MTTDKTFTTGSRHSEKDIKDELRAMLSYGEGLSLTLGTLMLLYLEDSPYVLGGDVTGEDLALAGVLVGRPRGMKDDEFHDALCGEIATAWRAYEIISPSQDGGGGRQSRVEMFSPEWLADTIGMACAAMPSLTLHQVLWEAPLALVLHLAISTARRNGTVTERPPDIMAALKKMREKENGENHA
jgi:hypothetical protein